MWTPDPAIIVTAEAKVEQTQRDMIERFRSETQRVIDKVAQSRAYDSGNSMASYVASTDLTWAREARIFVAWRDTVWKFAYARLESVQSGQEEIPTVEQFLQSLPQIDWNAP